MNLNDLINGKIRILGLGLILAGCGGDGSETPAGGCKNDSECKGNRYCIDGECVEGSGNGGKDTNNSSGTDTVSGTCDPDNYENSCEGLVLTYCHPDLKIVTSVNCNDYGMSNCGYAHQKVVKAVCFGDGKLGAKCELPPLSLDTDERDWKYFIKVECDFNDVELFCDGDYCTKMCEQDSDCSGEIPICTEYVNNRWCAPGA